MRLVADVGGTNSRLALSQAGTILTGSTQSFANADRANLGDIIKAYLAQHSGASPREMVAAVAGPVQGNRAVLTNRNWVVETGQLAAQFGIENVHLFNDLTALGFSVPHLSMEHMQQVHQGEAPKATMAQSLVVGIGTGFNVSPVFQRGGAFVCPAVEFGHMTLPSGVAQQLEKLGLNVEQYTTVEDLFSGRGFADFCQRISGDPTLMGPAAIEVYGQPDSPRITYAIDQYAALLGHLARDLSLIYLPTSGVYFSGSVARAVLETAAHSFVSVLHTPCKILRTDALPVFVIRDDAAALLGCAGFSFP
jgi:glucokinase